MSSQQPRFASADLRALAAALFVRAGLAPDKSEVVSRIMVEADMLGRSTHGLALSNRYLTDIESGTVLSDGAPTVIADRGACVTWDGRMLPGIWLTEEAVKLAAARAPTYGTATVVVSNGHHIGCLAAYLRMATERGLMITVATSIPTAGCVAPFGGTRALFTTNPIAVGIPTEGDPILLDTSASVTTNNMVGKMVREGRRFDHEWLLDKDGHPSADPQVVKNGGTILPAGGLDHGQKGYNWAIMVEALTQALPGFGRADQPASGGSGIFVQVLDPSAFGGLPAYTRQTTWLAEACRSNPPRPGIARVRVPGEQSLANRRMAEKTGIALSAGALADLKKAAERLSVEFPEPINSDGDS